MSDKYKGRSINLALSARGLAALENVGLDQMVRFNNLAGISLVIERFCKR